MLCFVPVLLLGFLLGISGCSRDIAVSPILDSDKGYWELRLNHNAVQLSLGEPYNTITLEAIPHTPTGDVWSPTSGDAKVMDTSATVFTSTDSSKVRVDQHGVVTAWAVQSGTVYIIARKRIAGVTHADSALVRVADVVSLPKLDTFRVRPPAGDSLKKAIGSGGLPIPIVVLDTSGRRMTGYPISIRSSTERVASLSSKWSTATSVNATLRNPGVVVFTAATWIYGVAKKDTFMFTVGYPLTRNLFVGMYDFFFYGIKEGPASIIGPGGTVGWVNRTGCQVEWAQGCKAYGREAPADGYPIDIVFDDPANVLPAMEPSKNTGGGNMLDISGDTAHSQAMRMRYRRFLTPGIYRYRVLPTGEVGAIIVQEEGNRPPLVTSGIP